MKTPSLPIASSPFRTRKRSFDAAWGSRAAWASVLGVSIATSAAFTAVMVFLMSPRQVRFFNVRAANLSDLRSAAFPGEVSLSSGTPLLFFGEKEVVLGTVASIIAPKRDESLMVAPRENWEAVLARQAASHPSLKGVLPSKVFVLGFDERLTDEGNLVLARKAASFATSLSSGKTPTIVFARVPGLKQTTGAIK